MSDKKSKYPPPSDPPAAAPAPDSSSNKQHHSDSKKSPSGSGGGASTINNNNSSSSKQPARHNRHRTPSPSLILESITISPITTGSGTNHSSGGGVGGGSTHSNITHRQRVDHTYHDFSRYVEEIERRDNRRRGEGPVTSKKRSRDGEILEFGNNFPAKLHKILSAPQFSRIITWMPHGRAWMILDKELLLHTVIPKYFSAKKFQSFTRQLSGWGFKRLYLNGPDSGCYYHEMFLRGIPELVKLIKRVPLNLGKPIPNPEEEPDFYRISRLHPLPDQLSSSQSQSQAMTMQEEAEDCHEKKNDSSVKDTAAGGKKHSKWPSKAMHGISMGGGQVSHKPSETGATAGALSREVNSLQGSKMSVTAMPSSSVAHHFNHHPSPSHQMVTNSSSMYTAANSSQYPHEQHPVPFHLGPKNTLLPTSTSSSTLSSSNNNNHGKYHHGNSGSEGSHPQHPSASSASKSAAQQKWGSSYNNTTTRYQVGGQSSLLDHNTSDDDDTTNRLLYPDMWEEEHQSFVNDMNAYIDHFCSSS